MKKIRITVIILFLLFLVGCNKSNNKTTNITNSQDTLYMEDKTFTYDGKTHSLEVEGDVSLYTIEYSNNNKTNAGTYEVVAKIYKNLELYKEISATLIINKANISVSLNSNSYIYTASEVELDVTSEAPLNYTYYKDGEVIDRPTNVGQYQVKISFDGDNNFNSYEKIFDFEIVKEKLICKTCSQVKDISSPYLDISASDFNYSDVNYTVTYDNEITGIGNYIAHIHVDETDLYSSLDKYVTLSVTTNEIENIISIMNILYFEYEESKTTYATMLLELYNDSNENISANDFQIRLGDETIAFTSGYFKASSRIYVMIANDVTKSSRLLNGFNCKAFTRDLSIIQSAKTLSLVLNSVSYDIDLTKIKDERTNYYANKKVITSMLNTTDEYSTTDFEYSQSNISFVLNKFGTYKNIIYGPTATLNFDFDTISFTRQTDLDNIVVTDYYGSKFFVEHHVDTSNMKSENINQKIEITYTVIDLKTYNSITFSIFLKFVDEEGPVFEELDGTYIFELDDTIPDLKTYVKAFDDIDGEIDSENIEVKTNLDTSQEGVYEAFYKVTDSSGNVGTYKIKFAVKGYSNTTISLSENLYSDGPQALINGSTCPTTGNVKVLVVPLEFDNVKFTDEMLTNVEKGFNGDESEVAWQSVKSYYKTSSYNKLNFTFNLTSPVTMSKTSSSYQDYISIYKEALSKVDSSVDFNTYNLDNNNYVDAVWFIYSIDYNSSSNLFWAFTVNVSSQNITYDDLIIGPTAFASYKFFIDASENNILPRTIIHETGHILGLDDYYDYSYDYRTVGTSHCLYYIDMMDTNIGDHNAASKLLLGWVEPIIVNDISKVNLTSFTETGKCVVITNQSKEEFSIYSEYFVLEFFTPTGLNEYDSLDGKMYGKDKYGVKLLHVDARMNLNSKGIPTYNGGTHSTYFINDNTDNDSFNFLEIIPESVVSYTPVQVSFFSYSAGTYNTTNALYDEQGETFGINTYQNYVLNNGTNLYFSFRINKISTTSVTVEIYF